MVRHVLTLFSAPAYVCGITCFAALLSRLQRTRFSPGAASPTKANEVHSRRVLFLPGAVCVLASFLFLPTGSFPAYAHSGAAILFWFVLFGGACAAFALGVSHPKARSAQSLLVTPFFLVAVYAVCARYAWLRGFPGNVWSMESFVVMPLVSGAGLVRSIGFFCLAAATILHCASTLDAGDEAPFLRACLCLASAQFTICLFFPVLPSRIFALSPVAALAADYVLNWCLIALLVLLVFPLAAASGTLRRLPLPLAAAGTVLCLL